MIQTARASLGVHFSFAMMAVPGVGTVGSPTKSCGVSVGWAKGFGGEDHRSSEEGELGGGTSPREGLLDGC